MTSAFDAEMATVASDLLNEFGESATVIAGTTVYDDVTGKKGASPSNFRVRCVQIEREDDAIDATEITRGNILLAIQPLVASNRIMRGQNIRIGENDGDVVDWSIVDVQPIRTKPNAGRVILYMATCRA